MPKKGKRWSVQGPVENEVRRLLAEKEGVSAKEIFDSLRTKQLLGVDPERRRRTIERLVADIRDADQSGPWTLAEAEPDEAALVLPVLAEVMDRTDGRAPPLTKLGAEWIARLRRAAPDLPPWWAFRIAFAYSLRKALKGPTGDLDALLAFAPWRSAEDMQRFLRFVQRAHRDWIQIDWSLAAAEAGIGAKMAMAEGVAIAFNMSSEKQRVQRIQIEKRGGENDA